MRPTAASASCVVPIEPAAGPANRPSSLLSSLLAEMEPFFRSAPVSAPSLTWAPLVMRSRVVAVPPATRAPAATATLTAAVNIRFPGIAPFVTSGGSGEDPFVSGTRPATSAHHRDRSDRSPCRPGEAASFHAGLGMPRSGNPVSGDGNTRRRACTGTKGSTHPRSSARLSGRAP